MPGSEFMSKIYHLVDGSLDQMNEQFAGKVLGEEGFTKEDVMKLFFDDFKPGKKLPKKKKSNGPKKKVKKQLNQFIKESFPSEIEKIQLKNAVGKEGQEGYKKQGWMSAVKEYKENLSNKQLEKLQKELDDFNASQE